MRVLPPSLALLLTAACTSTPDPGALEAELLAADRAFNRAVQEHDMEAFRDRVAPDAVFYGTGVLRGRDAVAEAWTDIVSGEIGLVFEPSFARAAASGDLGYTMGEATFRIPTARGEVEVSTSRYVTIWEKGSDGTWRAAVDIGTPRQEVSTP